MKSAVNVPQRNEKQLLAAVMQQPVAVAIDAEHGGFRSYHRGVMGGKCGTKIDHSVLVVGFGVESVPLPPPPGKQSPPHPHLILTSSSSSSPDPHVILSGPTVSCAVPTTFIGCFNVNGSSVLPKVASRDHDKLTLENCAEQCEGMNLTVAGVDAGNVTSQQSGA